MSQCYMDQLKHIAELITYRDNLETEHIYYNAVTTPPPNTNDPDPSRRPTTITDAYCILANHLRHAAELITYIDNLETGHMDTDTVTISPQNINDLDPPPRRFSQPQPRPQFTDRNRNRQGKERASLPYEWTPDNRPICYFCGIVGHTQRTCRRKRTVSTRQPRHPSMRPPGNQFSSAH